MLKETYQEILEKILNPKDKIIYLAGAGISMDPPSSLPSANQFSRILLSLCTPEEEVDTLLSLPGMRYEMIVERVQRNYDKNLDFLNYLEQITSPNIIHLYLGWEIINKHPVITTNFDFLIEHALKQNLPEVEYPNIFPVITKQQFLDNQNFQDLYLNGKFPLYKIHGSKKNIITGEDTTPTLITTLISLGKDRDEGETFSIEPYKKETINNLLDNSTLIVMGYSGNDVFDIGPLLLNFPTLNKLIWIDHSFNKSIKIDEILSYQNIDLNQLSACDRILYGIRNSHEYKIFKIEANTKDIVSNVLWKHLLAKDQRKNENFPVDSKIISFESWVEPMFKEIKEAKKIFIATKIYSDLAQNEKLIHCAKKGLELSKIDKDPELNAYFLNFIGQYHSGKGNYEDAIKFFNEALIIEEESDLKFLHGTSLNSIGYISRKKGDFQEALGIYEEARKIFEEINNYRGLAYALNNIGEIYEELNEADKALDYYESSLQLIEKIGSLPDKAAALTNIGELYHMKLNDLEKALMYAKESLKINEEIGNKPELATNFNNIAVIYCEMNEFKKAQELYNKALKIYEELGDLYAISITYSNLGCLKEDENNINEAIYWMKKALELNQLLSDSSKKSENLIVLGQFYSKLEDYDAAISAFQEAHSICLEKKYKKMSLTSLYNLAETFYLIGKDNEAINTYLKAINLAEEYHLLDSKLNYLNNLGMIYAYLYKYDSAMTCYNKALDLSINLGDKPSQITVLKNIGDVYSYLKNSEGSFEKFQNALTLAKELGDKEEMTEILYELGRNLSERRKFMDAIEIYGELLSIYKELKDVEGQQSVLGSLGYCAVGIGDYENAKIFCSKAFALAKILNMEKDIQIQQENLDFINKKLNP